MKKKMEMKMKLLQIHPLLPTYEYDGSVDGFSSTWNPTRPIIEMKFGQGDCNNFQFLKESTKMEKIVFLNLVLKPLKPRISGTQIHHYPLPLSLLGHMVVCISLLLYNHTTTEISVSVGLITF